MHRAIHTELFAVAEDYTSAVCEDLAEALREQHERVCALETVLACEVAKAGLPRKTPPKRGREGGRLWICVPLVSRCGLGRVVAE